MAVKFDVRREKEAVIKFRHHLPIKLAVHIALSTGMRRGEVCGLRWSDFDAESQTLSVNRAIGISEHGWYVKEPKTKASRRTASSAIRGDASFLGRSPATAPPFRHARNGSIAAPRRAPSDGAYPAICRFHNGFRSPAPFAVGFNMSGRGKAKLGYGNCRLRPANPC